MIRRSHGIIGFVNTLTGRVAIGLGALVAALVGIGYAFVYAGIAAPLEADLGTLAVPDEGGVAAAYLADGRPVFVVRAADGIHVVDARAPVDPGVPGHLVVFCDPEFYDLAGGTTYAPDGTLFAGPPDENLTTYPVTVVSGGREVVVGGEGAPATSGLSEPPESNECWVDIAVMHVPDADEVFDPSVAADEEPPGWIWLEGRLVAAGGQALLCDGHGGDCATGAVVRGINPATIADNTLGYDGYFLGRVHDGAIEELHFSLDAEKRR